MSLLMRVYKALPRDLDPGVCRGNLFVIMARALSHLRK